jgi:hypothetical protein
VRRAVIPGLAQPEPGTHEHGRRLAWRKPVFVGSRLRGNDKAKRSSPATVSYSSPTAGLPRGLPPARLSVDCLGLLLLVMPGRRQDLVCSSLPRGRPLLSPSSGFGLSINEPRWVAVTAPYASH